MENTKYITLASILIAISIGIGAFGAHILNPGLEDKYVRTLATANLYFMVMSVALFGIGALIRRIPELRSPYWLILFGVICFSGSLYIIVLSKFWNTDVPSIVGPITPIGGILMIIGWLWCALKIKKHA